MLKINNSDERIKNITAIPYAACIFYSIVNYSYDNTMTEIPKQAQTKIP